MRPGELSSQGALAPAPPAPGEASVTHGLVAYNVLLLAGEPRRHTCALQQGIEAGAEVEVSGELWTVADVREAPDGGSPTLVCIYTA